MLIDLKAKTYLYCYNVNMRQLKKILKNANYIVFFDLESTQIKHYVISIGAIKVEIDDKGLPKRDLGTFNCFVKAKEKVGNIVRKMTNITDKLLDEQGITFKDAIKQFKKMFEHNINRTIFFTYGNGDKGMLINSIEKGDDETKEIVNKIIKRTYDLSRYISEYIKDENNNVLSLQKLLVLFKIKTTKQAHDALSDAIDLKNVYSAFLKEKDIVFENYRRLILNNIKLPRPLILALKTWKKGESVDEKMFDSFIWQDIND